ncbi:putative 16S rRNA processing protein [Nostoc sp. NIES-3756]|uniref:ribosome maturation factor RimM n=1 Tax=Nostoc sp. NIES-3756 TaxID=1751286 RepID=UPI00072059A6|nr:ribosome maturation factor RimM [Nostoc sp. NIES-3756]BAT51208.1 putative 16S rRNA processing protein [Nostoc sp. NIES-3756]
MKRKQENRKEAGGRRQEAGGRRQKKIISPSSSPTPPTPSSPSPLPNPDDWLQIGKIVAPQGLSGEVRVYSDSDFPERFEVPGTRWILRPGQTEPQPIELLYGRYLEGKNLYVLELVGVENRNQAEELRGCILYVPASDRPELGEDEYHVADLIGMEVFLQASGDLIGTVVDIIPAGHDLLEVSLHQPIATDKKLKTVLIPFVKAIASVVDLQTRRIEITPPPGLLELGNEG